MTTPTEEATDLYARLKPDAVAAAHSYVLDRTRADLQTIMVGLIAADLDPPPDPLITEVHNGDTVNVRMWDASTVPATAVVAGGSLTRLDLAPIASKAIIANGASVVVHDAADANSPGSPGAATVAAGVFTKVNLTV